MLTLQTNQMDNLTLYHAIETDQSWPTYSIWVLQPRDNSKTDQSVYTNQI